MKSKPSIRAFMALSGSAFLAITTAQADILHWDGGNADILTDGNGVSAGGAGTWNTSLLNWDIGASPHVAWNSGDYAVMAGTGNTVTVGSGVVTSGIDFTGNSYVIDATSNGLAFGSGSNQMRIAGNNWQATINGAVAGTGSMHIQAIHTGTLGVNPPPTINFGGTSTGGWQGSTTITRAAVLAMSGDSQVLNSTSGITLNGGIIQLTNASATSITSNRINDDAAITINNGGLIRITNTNSAGNVYSENIGDVTLNSGYASFHFTVNLNTTGTTQKLILDSFTRNNNSVVSFGPSANTAGAIEVTGASQTAANEIIGAWALHGNGNTDNDFAVYNASGQVVARAATLNGNESTWSTSWSVAANTATNLAAGSLSANRTFNTLRFSNGSSLGLGDNVLAAYGILNGGGNYTLNAGTNGYITIPTDNGNQALYLNSGNGNLTVNAPIKDNGSAKLTLVHGGGGSGSRTDLNGDNTYSGGTVISRSAVRNSATTGSGELRIGHNNAFGDSANYLRFDSGILNLQTFDVTVGEFSGGPSSYINASAGGSITVGTGTSSASSTEFKGLIIGGQLVKNGDGRLILSGHNAAAATAAQYTVNGGTLQFGKIVSFFGGTTADTTNTANWTKARTIVNSGGTLAFNVGGAGEFTTGHVTTLLTNLAGSNAAGTEGFQAGSRIGFDTTNAAGGTFTVADAIADSTGAGGGAIGLTKLGTGAIILSNTSTHTGATTVSAGTLLVTGALSSSTVIVQANGTIGSNGAAGTLGSGLTIAAGGNLDLTGATLGLNSTGILSLTGGNLTLGNLTFQDLVGWNWLAAAPGTYELIDGTFSVDFGSTAFISEATAYDFGNGKKGYFTAGSLNAVIVAIPEPSAALLGGLGLLALLRRRRN